MCQPFPDTAWTVPRPPERLIFAGSFDQTPFLAPEIVVACACLVVGLCCVMALVHAAQLNMGGIQLSLGQSDNATLE